MYGNLRCLLWNIYILCIVLATLLPVASAKTYYIINASDAGHTWINKDYAADIYISDIQQKDPNADIEVISSTEEFGNLITTLKDDPSSARESVIINANGEDIPFPKSYDDGDNAIEQDESLQLLSDIRAVMENGATWENPAGYPFYYTSNHDMTIANGSPEEDYKFNRHKVGSIGAKTVIGQNVDFWSDADADNWTNPTNSSDWFIGSYNRPLSLSELNSLNGTSLYGDGNESVSSDIPIGNGSLVSGGINGWDASQLDRISSRMGDYIIDKMGADNPTAPVRTPISAFAIIITVLLLPALLYRHYN